MSQYALNDNLMATQNEPKKKQQRISRAHNNELEKTISSKRK